MYRTHVAYIVVLRFGGLLGHTRLLHRRTPKYVVHIYRVELDACFDRGLLRFSEVLLNLGAQDLSQRTDMKKRKNCYRMTKKELA